MGMIWNSPATLEMIRRVNLEFCGDNTIDKRDSPNGEVPPIKYWRDRKHLFVDDKDLTVIASDNNVTSPTENAHWMEWLTAIGDHKKADSAHEKLRKAIYDGLDQPNKYYEIVFVVVPIKRDNKVKVSPTVIDYTYVITVETPTYDTIEKSIARRIAKRRYARKKAAKKKKG